MWLASDCSVAKFAVGMEMSLFKLHNSAKRDGHLPTLREHLRVAVKCGYDESFCDLLFLSLFNDCPSACIGNFKWGISSCEVPCTGACT